MIIINLRTSTPTPAFGVRSVPSCSIWNPADWQTDSNSYINNLDYININIDLEFDLNCNIKQIRSTSICSLLEIDNRNFVFFCDSSQAVSDFLHKINSCSKQTRVIFRVFQDFLWYVATSLNSFETNNRDVIVSTERTIHLLIGANDKRRENLILIIILWLQLASRVWFL